VRIRVVRAATAFACSVVLAGLALALPVRGSGAADPLFDAFREPPARLRPFVRITGVLAGSRRSP
jgi:hypothetical protein